MKRFLIVSVLCVALLGAMAPTHASEGDGTITIEWDGAQLECDQVVTHIDDVVSSPYYYLIHYPPYGIFWIVTGAEDSVRCLRDKISQGV